MRFFKRTMPFSALGIAFLSIGFFTSDIRMISFGIVWFIIAAAKYVLATDKDGVKKTN